ncbi:MAG: hypothetical protein JNM59_00210 [Hyphomonadaceae bacterium]|nr:hypothetical protein [Hyphomonadaceae bacterium]
MLQHNASRHHAHAAHAAVVSLHAICCGLPVLALAAVGISGVTSSTALFAESVNFIHNFLHRYEIWIVAVSGGLVALGALLEVLARQRSPGLGFPWMFAISVAAFFVNVAIIVSHRV